MDGYNRIYFQTIENLIPFTKNIYKINLSAGRKSIRVIQAKIIAG